MGSYAGQYGCWAYDSFGNRTLESFGIAPCPATPLPTVSYDSTNRVNTAAGIPFTYDPAGNVQVDALNSYAYDGEGRLCAFKNYNNSYTQYVYNAEGGRVAKGTTTTSLTCGAPGTGFSLQSQYLLGLGGEQVTELDGGNNWKHSNVWTGGKILATYDSSGIHFPLTDPLGTKRVQARYDGQVDETCLSLPFGNGLNCSGTDATEHHFTGKERDSESGNDYFPARYYASSMGRWLSPDWSGTGMPVPYADFNNPQSLNLYAYLNNNPLSHVDPYGHYHCDPDTFERNGDAMELKTGACHMDASDLASMGFAVGHHFVDQAVTKAQNAWNSLAGQFFRRWTTGPLKPGGPHSGFPTPARLSQQQIQKIIQDVARSSGKSMSEWGPEEINQAKQEVANAGGDTGAFLESIAAENPMARTAQQDTSDIMQTAQKAWQSIQNAASQVGPAIEEGVEDVEEECGGGGCIPPL